MQEGRLIFLLPEEVARGLGRTWPGDFSVPPGPPGAATAASACYNASRRGGCGQHDRGGS